MASSQLPQVWTALITPFNSEGEIDWSAYEKLLDKQILAGVTGIVLSGTTGEAPALTEDEKVSLVKRAKDYSQKKLKIMVGTGSNNTFDSARLSVKVCKAGAESLLVVTPPYNKPSLSGLVKHFEFIAKESGAPICLYHVPGRTAQLLSAKDMKVISDLDNVFAIKEASGDLSLFSRVLQECPKTLIFSGDDPTYLPSLSIGGHGCISVLTNAFPKAFVSLSKAFAESDLKKASFLHKAFFPMIENLFCETNPAPVKFLMSEMGLCKNSLRLPLAPVTASSEEKIRKSLYALQTSLESEAL